MKLDEIVQLTNIKLADELCSYIELKPYFDMVVDEINATMNTVFPVFPTLPLTTDEYTAFPDQYVRSVVVPGAAHKYYVADEEGSATATQYATDYQSGMFYMLRDYSHCVPEEYMADRQQGSVRAQWDEDYGDRGIELNGYNF